MILGGMALLQRHRDSDVVAWEVCVCVVCRSAPGVSISIGLVPQASNDNHTANYF